jgi:UDP-glucose 4-epimerase
MRILVTGGAGYVGSHAVAWLLRAGHEVCVYDNLELGHAEAVPAARLIRADLHDGLVLARVLREHQIEAVMHFAARALVGESVADPALYYGENIAGTLSLLEAMRAAGVDKIVFSSTCATYGEPEAMPIREDTPQRPVNPYGRSKLAIEWALRDYAAAYGIGYAALRYFNACGAAESGDLGEHHSVEAHLIPLTLQVALGQREAITIYGDDYPTPDGTCVRDYIHVDDLAEAHRLALAKLAPGRGIELNLGTGRGFSVREVIESCRRVTGHPIPARVGARRPGDPPELVADPSRAREQLGFRARVTEIDDIVRSAWNWHSRHPRGYASAI